jgi:hypothetical protein
LIVLELFFFFPFSSIRIILFRSLRGWACPNDVNCTPVCHDGVVVYPQEECDEKSLACTDCRVRPGTLSNLFWGFFFWLFFCLFFRTMLCCTMLYYIQLYYIFFFYTNFLFLGFYCTNGLNCKRCDTMPFVIPLNLAIPFPSLLKYNQTLPLVRSCNDFFYYSMLCMIEFCSFAYLFSSNYILTRRLRFRFSRAQTARRGHDPHC